MKAYRIVLEEIEVPDTSLCAVDPFEVGFTVWTTLDEDQQFFNVFNEDAVEQCLLAEDHVKPKDIVFMLHASIGDPTVL